MEKNTEASVTRTLARLIGIQICINGSMAGIRMAAPLLALRHGYSAAAVGVLLALFALVQLFCAIPAGRYADRSTLRRPITVYAGAAVLGGVVAAIWPIFPVLCLAAVLSGVATGATVITTQRHAGRLADTPERLKQVFSWLAIAPSLANFLGPLLAGLVIDYFGFSTCFAVMACLATLPWWLVRNATDAPPDALAPPTTSGSFWSLLDEPRMRVLLLINWVLSSCWDVHTFVLPILGHERGFSASVIGILLGTFAVAATLVRVVMSAIAGHLREWAVIMGAVCGAAVIYAIYPLLPSALAMGVCSGLLGLVLGSVQPMVMSTLHQITPVHRQGEALGLRMMTINVSSILTPMVFGTLGAAVGVASVFWAVAVTVGCSSRAVWRLRELTKTDVHGE